MHGLRIYKILPVQSIGKDDFSMLENNPYRFETTGIRPSGIPMYAEVEETEKVPRQPG